VITIDRNAQLQVAVIYLPAFSTLSAGRLAGQAARRHDDRLQSPETGAWASDPEDGQALDRPS